MRHAIAVTLAAFDLTKRLEHAAHGPVVTRERNKPIAAAHAKVKNLKLPGPK